MKRLDNIFSCVLSTNNYQITSNTPPKTTKKILFLNCEFDHHLNPIGTKPKNRPLSLLSCKLKLADTFSQKIHKELRIGLIPITSDLYKAISDANTELLIWLTKTVFQQNPSLFF